MDSGGHYLRRFPGHLSVHSLVCANFEPDKHNLYPNPYLPTDSTRVRLQNLGEQSEPNGIVGSPRLGFAFQVEALARVHRFSLHSLWPQDLVDEKQVCEQCAEMDRSIQVI